MISQETREFLENSDRRLAGIDPENLNGLFDKFGSLYSVFNRLYNEVYEILKLNGKLSKPRIADWERAIVLPVDFIGADEMIQTIVNSGSERSINDVITLMNEGIFAINLAEGVQKKELDDQLKINLLNQNSELRARAILNLIYQVRNNMQHGQKHFEEHQRLLLEPVIILLENVLELLKIKLQI